MEHLLSQTSCYTFVFISSDTNNHHRVKVPTTKMRKSSEGHSEVCSKSYSTVNSRARLKTNSVLLQTFDLSRVSMHPSDTRGSIDWAARETHQVGQKQVTADRNKKLCYKGAPSF